MNATAHIVALLKRKPCTYAEMMAPGGKIISTCPHKRVKEWLGSAANDAPMPVYELKTGRRWIEGSRYLTTWRLVRVKR